MRKFKIEVISVLLKGNKVANYNDIVDESLLMSDAEDLVKRGFISEIESENENEPENEIENEDEKVDIGGGGIKNPKNKK